MTESTESGLALVFSFYEGVSRKAPGSSASTLKAVSMLGDLPECPRVIDFGCGSGAASLTLAQSRACHLTAVDIHQRFLDDLLSLAVRDGLEARIKVVRADMADPPFPDGSFDVVWAEGAIYNIGFHEGLRKWRRLLSTGGHIAVTEVAWLHDSPPSGAVDYWQAEYPAITSIEENLSKLRSAGFEPVGHFVLPSSDWQDYYGPVEVHLADFRSKYRLNSEAQSLADSVQKEIDVWRQYGSSYGYVFFLGRAT